MNDASVDLARRSANRAKDPRRAFHPRRRVVRQFASARFVADARDALVVDWNRHVKILVVVSLVILVLARARRTTSARKGSRGARVSSPAMACASRVARWTMCPSRSRVSEGTISASVDASGGSRTRRRASRVASDPRRFLRADGRARASSRARSPRARHRVHFGRLLRAGR